jgi:hypothetical protein
MDSGGGYECTGTSHITIDGGVQPHVRSFVTANGWWECDYSSVNGWERAVNKRHHKRARVRVSARAYGGGV